jgi:uncharacterized protein (DUF1015 family)
MVDVAPFAGIRYADAIDPTTVTSPPYDVISPDDRDALERASPYNAVRLDLGRDEPGDDEITNKYTRASGWLRSWLAEGILRRDDPPALYEYEVEFSLGGGRRRVRGVLGAIEITDDVLPHERTMPSVIDDRLAFLRATRANISPVFCLSWGQRGTESGATATAGGQAVCDFIAEDGTAHRAWRLDDPEPYAKGLAGAEVVIADGHHRFHTAAVYRDERRRTDGAGPWDRTLAFLVEAGGTMSPDLPALLPIHRLVSGIEAPEALERLRGVFDIEPAAAADLAELETELADRRRAGRCYLVVDQSEAWWITLRDPSAEAAAMPPKRSAAWRDLDVAVLHALVFDRLWGSPQAAYVHSAAEAADAVRARSAPLAVLLAPTPLEAVRAVAEAREAMPPKSTFFLPKPRTGIVLRTLD